MPRNHRPRRRPPGRHRPPGRQRSGHGPTAARPQGFTPPGWRQLFDVVLPHKGPAKKAFFNEVGGGIALAAGVVGAVIGFAPLGVFGAVLGLGAGVSLGGMALEEGRYIRR